MQNARQESFDTIGRSRMRGCDNGSNGDRVRSARWVRTTSGTGNGRGREHGTGDGRNPGAGFGILGRRGNEAVVCRLRLRVGVSSILLSRQVVRRMARPTEKRCIKSKNEGREGPCIFGVLGNKKEAEAVLGKMYRVTVVKGAVTQVEETKDGRGLEESSKSKMGKPSSGAGQA